MRTTASDERGRTTCSPLRRRRAPSAASWHRAWRGSCPETAARPPRSSNVRCWAREASSSVTAASTARARITNAKRPNHRAYTSTTPLRGPSRPSRARPACSWSSRTNERRRRRAGPARPRRPRTDVDHPRMHQCARLGVPARDGLAQPWVPHELRARGRLIHTCHDLYTPYDTQYDRGDETSVSVPFALLALLSDGPKYGLRLQNEFESRTGEVWPLNVGQVYSTLQRLERDGLVETDGEGAERAQKRYRITPNGERELAEWLRTAPALVPPPRDELVIKVLVALQIPGIDVHEILQVHRRHVVEVMQRYTKIKAAAGEGDVALALVADAELFRLEAIVRWLDAADVRLKQRTPVAPAPVVDAPVETPSTMEVSQ